MSQLRTGLTGNLEMYQNNILPSIPQQVVSCNDVRRVSPAHTGPFLSATAQLHPKVNMKQSNRPDAAHEAESRDPEEMKRQEEVITRRLTRFRTFLRLKQFETFEEWSSDP